MMNLTQRPENQASNIKDWLSQSLLTFVMVLALICFHTASAQDINNDPRFGDVWKKSQELRNKPSVDTAPVEFTFGGVKYRVLRNYMVRFDGPLTLPTFRVTYPGFEPLTEKTSQCLTQPRAKWPPGCQPVEFWIESSGESPVLSDEDHFKNGQKAAPAQEMVQDQYGFMEYRYGPDDKPNRILFKKKTGKHTLLLDCFGSHLICSNTGSPLPNGNAVSYRLNFEQVKDAEQIDDGIRDLIASFTIAKGEEP